MCESREKTRTTRKDERASEERLWTRVKFCPCRTRAPTLLGVQSVPSSLCSLVHSCNTSEAPTMCHILC